jgi:hypothetical protein
VQRRISVAVRAVDIRISPIEQDLNQLSVVPLHGTVQRPVPIRGGADRDFESDEKLDERYVVFEDQTVINGRSVSAHLRRVAAALTVLDRIPETTRQARPVVSGLQCFKNE